MGIHSPLQIYELIEFSTAAAEEQRKTVELFHEALVLFEGKDWAAAEAGFRRILNFSPHEGPSKLFLERCENNRRNPPPVDWDGVFELRYY